MTLVLEVRENLNFESDTLQGNVKYFNMYIIESSISLFPLIVEYNTDKDLNFVNGFSIVADV